MPLLVSAFGLLVLVVVIVLVIIVFSHLRGG